MVVADLHVHTTNSDGVLTLAEVPAAARDAGLDAVAVTDHDRLHPDLDQPVERLEGVVLIHGIELRVDAGDQRVDLLGYGVEPTEALTAEIDRLQRDRLARGRAIIERVEDRLDVTLPVEPERGLGRPDVARAVVASDAGYESVGAVFDDLIADDGPCYVPREVTSFERGRRLLTDACAVVSLAHPLRYPGPDAALDLAPRLDAVERYYPYGDEGHTAADGSVDTDAIQRIADRHDLLVTGGSDAHGRTLGAAGLARKQYDAFATALGDAETGPATR